MANEAGCATILQILEGVVLYVLLCAYTKMALNGNLTLPMLYLGFRTSQCCRQIASQTGHSSAANYGTLTLHRINQMSHFMGLSKILH